eukprot:NODE_1100_length_1105_cov_256.340909_g841_i0.p1 GENE.NODE_1100_length_1105_cov_256.340909_g841_i0~~NODE_1100_length_1105_cov_256.340909_g841_i0.p1  ORF type:complete len:324 (-),score=78.72 NODE_1100_length_1105_cov_256.340909_g841_i0:132-1040(-)
MDAIFGAVASCAAMSICNPFDVVKSRLQMQGEMSKDSPRLYGGIGRSLVKIGRVEGITRLYSGLVAALWYQLIGNGVRFGVYGVLKEAIGIDETMAAPWERIGVALVSGTAAGFAACPLFALKTRMQVATKHADLAVGTQHTHPNFRAAFAHIYHSQGLRGYWNGWRAFVPRVMALVTAQLATYDIMKTIIKNNEVLPEGVITQAASSSAATAVAVLTMQPFDLVASRLMNQPHENGKPTKYHGAVDCLLKTVRSEGIPAVYKGGLSNFCRMGPQYTLTFVFFEQLKSLSLRLQQQRKQGPD